MLQELKQLRGKTIEKAELCWAAYGGEDNRCLSLKFTDGTEFSLDVKAHCVADAAMFIGDGDLARKKIRLQSD